MEKIRQHIYSFKTVMKYKYSHTYSTEHRYSENKFGSHYEVLSCPGFLRCDSLRGCRGLYSTHFQPHMRDS